jgi:hypothetical protein
MTVGSLNGDDKVYVPKRAKKGGFSGITPWVFVFTELSLRTFVPLNEGRLEMYDVLWSLKYYLFYEWVSVPPLPEAAQNGYRDTFTTSEIIIFRSQDLHFSKIYVPQLHILSDLFHSKGI